MPEIQNETKTRKPQKPSEILTKQQVQALFATFNIDSLSASEIGVYWRFYIDAV